MFKKILVYAGEYRKVTYRAMLSMVIGLAMSLVQFLFIYKLIRPLLMHELVYKSTAISSVVGIAVCGVLYAVFYVHGLALSHISAYNTLKNLRISLQRKLEKQPLGTIQEKGVGFIKKVFVDDIESIEVLLAHALPEGFSNLLIPILTFIGMFFVDWKLALLALLALPLGIFAIKKVYQTGKVNINDYYTSSRVMNNTIVEYINGMEVVKVFNRDGESYKRYERDVRNYRDFTLAWFKACWPWMALYNCVLPSVALFVLPFGAYFVLQGYSSLPNLALVLCLCFAVGAPLLRAMVFMSILSQIDYKISSMEDVMNAPALEQTDAPFMNKNHGISFEAVRFAYGKEEVIHGVSLDIPERSLTALVGESGSGKSTLAKLLVHYYDVTGGCIKIGGQDIRKMSIEALNKEISYVAQEQFLFNMSLLENIRLGNPDATDDEVMAAAEKAQCSEFLCRLEKGIHTMAGDGGKQLSGGERQRISLARAILKNAPIVVLDEATAFMDPDNEEKMNAAIAEVIKDKTVIVIAHRLNSIVDADKICVLDNGNLMAEGTHEELLKNCTTYHRLWSAAQESAIWKVSAESAVKKGDETK